jgi:hypothetical protein
MSAEVKVIHKRAQDLKKILRNYSHSYSIKVGFPEGMADVSYPDNPKREAKLKKLGLPPSRKPGEPPPTVKQVAVENEFGVSDKKVPPRPFMKESTPGLVKLLNTFFKRRVRLINKGVSSLDESVKEIAPLLADVIKKTITDLNTPDNADLTVFLKGSDNPLIDTGLMRQTVTSDVIKDEK